MAGLTLAAPRATLSTARSASTGAFATLILFALCWAAAAAAAGLVGSHALIGLFTLKAAGSTAALLEGGLWAWLGGGIGGVLIAHCYNLSGRIFGT